MSIDRWTRGNLQYWWRKMTETGVPCLFESSGEFAQWSVKNGYEYGKRLRRIDRSLEYSPDNCTWEDVSKESVKRSKYKDHEMKICREQWDEFVTPIRERFKDELERIANAENEPCPEEDKPGARKCWRYEHPDLVREGIMFTGVEE